MTTWAVREKGYRSGVHLARSSCIQRPIALGLQARPHVMPFARSLRSWRPCGGVRLSPSRSDVGAPGHQAQSQKAIGSKEKRLPGPGCGHLPHRTALLGGLIALLNCGAVPVCWSPRGDVYPPIKEFPSQAKNESSPIKEVHLIAARPTKASHLRCLTKVEMYDYLSAAGVIALHVCWLRDGR
jgi:hypothetical protein